VKKKISRKQKKKINRSGKFCCPICEEQKILQEHHIRGRNIPNENHPSNLAYICANCHVECHEDMIVIEGWFMTTSGRELFWHKKGDEGFTGEVARPYIIPK
jgi:hypothetical protein